jgi:malate synthase
MDSIAPGATPAGLELLAPVPAEYAAILTTEALQFVAELNRRFGDRRTELLVRRSERQAEWDAGTQLAFLDEMATVRSSEWTIAPLPEMLWDRRVEITGPAERKMIINALNSGARVFMADFEDALTPTWENLLAGQLNLRDAVRRTITYTSPEGKAYALDNEIATLFVRPRGWHLPEKHVRLDGQPISGSLFDFGLFFFHNAKEQIARGAGPYFYLPKMQSHREARLWNDVFVYAQQALGIPQGTIKATALIETLPAAFEMDEILYELREHSAGLNCGRWDYIFSAIKTRRQDERFILPDRALVTMTTPFMRAYSLLAIKTCHRRNAPAMGGMSAFIPVKGDAELNEKAFAQVRADKEREARDGHDGTWVAHPGLVAVAKQVFDTLMPAPNQIDRQRDDVSVSDADLLDVPEGPITEAGLRTNVSVGVQYVEAWLGGLAAVPLYNLMEDAATAEISRAQIWLWIHRPAGILTDGRKVTVELFREVLAEELARLKEQYGETAWAARHFEDARAIFDQLVTAPDLADFLTIPAYAQID